MCETISWKYNNYEPISIFVTKCPKVRGLEMNRTIALVQDYTTLRLFPLLRRAPTDILTQIKYLHIDMDEERNIGLPNLDMGIIVTGEDVVYTFGSNHAGRLGIELGDPETLKRIQQLSRLSFEGFSIGKEAVLGWTAYGRLYGWGRGINSQNPHTPMMLFINDITVLKASLGEKNFALTKTGQLYCWEGYQKPKIWNFGAGRKIIDFADAFASLCIICDQKKLYMCRYNDENPSGRTRLISVLRFEKITSSKCHFVATTTNGTLFMWGNDGSDSMLRSPRSLQVRGANFMICGAHAPICVALVGNFVIGWKIIERKGTENFVVLDNIGSASVIEFLAQNKYGMGSTIQLI